MRKTKATARAPSSLGLSASVRFHLVAPVPLAGTWPMRCFAVLVCSSFPCEADSTPKEPNSPDTLFPLASRQDRSQELCRQSCRPGYLHVAAAYGRACSRSMLPEPTASSNIPARPSLWADDTVERSSANTSGHQQDSQGQSLRLHADRRSIERLCNVVGVHARSSQRSKISNIVSRPRLTVPGCVGHCCSRRDRAFRTACKSLCSGGSAAGDVFSRVTGRNHFGSADGLSSPNSRSQTFPTRPRE